MELALFVWIASVISGIDDLLKFVAIICFGGAVFYRFINMIISNREVEDLISSDGQTIESIRNGFKTNSNILAALFFVSALFASIVPDNEKQIYLIGGAWALQTVGEKAINSETADYAVRIVNKKLKSYLEEMEENEDKKEKK